MSIRILRFVTTVGILSLASVAAAGPAVIRGVSQIEECIDEAVKVLVGRFGGDYAKANPKNKTSASDPSQ